MSAYRDSQSGIWRYEFQVAGTRYSKRGFNTKQEARDAEHEHRRQVKAGWKDPFPTFHHLCHSFLASSERTKSAAWVYQLRRKLDKGFLDLAKLHPREITRGHIELALDKLRASGENKAASLNEYRKIIVAVLNFGVEMQAIQSNVAAKIPRVPENHNAVQPIPKVDLQKLILAAPEGMRERLVFLSATGARWIEMSRLTKAEVMLDRDRPACVLRTRKRSGGHEAARPCPLNALAVDAVRRAMSGPGPLVFTDDGSPLYYRTELKRLESLCGKLELPRYSFHQIRHYVGTVAIAGGRSKKAVAQYLGQTDTNATERYIHADDPEMWALAKKLEDEMREVADFGGVAGGVLPKTGS